MVVGFSFVVQSAQANPSAEITKELRQCFDSSKVKSPPSSGKKIRIRNDIIYKPVRSEGAWKKKYERHQQQASRGFFSPVAQPYQTFGELELDLRELVVRTVGEKPLQKRKATIHELERGSLWAKLRDNLHLVKLDDDENGKSVKAKEQSCTKKKMISVIGKKLSVMNNRVIAVRAGQTYGACLHGEERKKKILEVIDDLKNEALLTLNVAHAPPFTRKKSVHVSRKSLVNAEEVPGLEDATKLDVIALQEYHGRKCKNFAAILKALYSLICCVYHLKTRDLRTKVPLNKDYLKVINTDVPIDAKGKPVRHQRVVPAVHNPSGSADSFHIRGSDSDRVTSTGTFPNDSLPNVSRPSAMESGSNLEKQSAGFGIKRWKNLSTRPNTMEDPSEQGSHGHQENVANRSGVSRCSFQATFNTAVGSVKMRRGHFLGMLANASNTAELPIWQQIATNERGDRRTRPGSMATPRKSDKRSKQRVLVEQLRFEFQDAQKRCLKRLSEEMTRINKLEKDSFRQKLRGFKMSHLMEHDMVTMRRATNKINQDYRDENVRPSGWFDTLCDQAEDLEVEDDDEVNTLMQKIAPFSKDDLKTLCHVKSKLCLVMQSLPLYELCQLSMQEALKFFLETILSSPTSIFQDWMAQRKIKPSLQ